MEIKTTENIKDMKYKRKSGKFFYGKRWVAVDDIHKKIAEILTIPDENKLFQQFFELQKELLSKKSQQEKDDGE